MENIVMINNEKFILRHVATRINYYDAMVYMDEGWHIPTEEQWDNLRDNYSFRVGTFSVEGSRIYLPKPDNTSLPYYWCNGGERSFVFDRYGTTFSNEKKEFHNGLVLLKRA